MKPKTVSFFGFKVSFQNLKETARILKDLFISGDYRFETNKEKPFILDCGSHIGLSILYFKKLYPKARIIGFEPNPNTFKLLKRNVVQNNLKNVELINAALSNRKGKSVLWISNEEKSPWTWGDAIVRNKWNAPRKSRKIKVRTVRLSQYIDKVVDFLKLDIEGAETRVLKEIKTKLPLVKKMVVEFHGSSTNKENNLKEILKILEETGFSYTIEQQGKLVKVEEVQKADPFWLIIHAKRAK